MFDFWNEFLYRPVFNVLIWIYNNFTNQNLGWAVVYLTLLLRFILLPFTLISEKTNADNKEVEKEVDRISKEFYQDAVQRKIEIRALLKKKKFRPWAKAITIGSQFFVLILLYQVFLRGITGRNLIQMLYPAVDFPGKINTNFYGFELGATHTFWWPFIVAVILFLEIYFEYKKHKGTFNDGHLAYIVLFPIFSFFALWFLPMVKSLFILTSILFSDIIHRMSVAIFVSKKSSKKE